MLKLAPSFCCLLISFFLFSNAQAQTERSINAPINEQDILPVESVPNMTTPTGSEVLKNNYSHIDPGHLVNDNILRAAILYYDVNLANIANKDFMTVIDFNLHSNQRRMFLINMKTGAVSAFLTAAGVNSDPDQDGYATLFSNVVDSHQSSLGFALTSSTYQGQNGYSLRMHGLSVTNSKIYERYIVVHGTAKYVFEDKNLAKNKSWGCPAVDDSVNRGLIDRIKGGSLVYFSHASLP